MKYEITKKQIFKIYKDSNTENRIVLKQWFPKAFKVELEVGQWYKWHDNILFITKIDGNEAWFYGVDEYSIWRDKDWYSLHHENKAIPATDQEVESALIAEAKKRGLKEFVSVKRNFENLPIKHINPNVFPDDKEFHFDKNDNFLECFGFVIYSKGQWAEIIPTMSIKEAEERLNCKIV